MLFKNNFLKIKILFSLKFLKYYFRKTLVLWTVMTMVIKPGLGVGPVKEPGSGFHGSIWINLDQPGLKKYI